MYDYTQIYIIIQLNNAGVLQLPKLGAYSAIATDGSNNITAINSETSGYVLTSNGGASAPTFQPSSGGGISWALYTTNQVLAKNNGYYANSGSVLTFTLPTTATVGDTYVISGVNTGGWIVAQNASQSIRFGNLITTTGTGGSLASTSIGDGVTIACYGTNQEFIVLPMGAIGNINVT